MWERYKMAIHVYKCLIEKRTAENRKEFLNSGIFEKNK
jgi:hypothetical protein